MLEILDCKGILEGLFSDRILYEVNLSEIVFFLSACRELNTTDYFKTGIFKTLCNNRKYEDSILGFLRTLSCFLSPYRYFFNCCFTIEVQV